MTPELPRAPCTAPSESAAAIAVTSPDPAADLASASADRMVNSKVWGYVKAPWQKSPELSATYAWEGMSKEG